MGANVFLSNTMHTMIAFSNIKALAFCMITGKRGCKIVANKSHNALHFVPHIGHPVNSTAELCWTEREYSSYPVFKINVHQHILTQQTSCRGEVWGKLLAEWVQWREVGVGTDHGRWWSHTVAAVYNGSQHKLTVSDALLSTVKSETSHVLGVIHTQPDEKPKYTRSPSKSVRGGSYFRTLFTV